MLARYLQEKAKVVALEEKNGRLLFVAIKDPEEVRAALGALLVRVEKLLATGNRRSALRLLKDFGTPAPWSGLEAVAQRARDAGLRPLIAFVMPKITGKKGASGRVEDAKISHNETYDRQVMRWRKY
jgi:hypothetical protein